jgi:mycothiol S-conjugate amidase
VPPLPKLSSSNETGREPDLAPYAIASHRLRATPAARRLLIAYAHPDDESFGSGGTIARYSAAGVAVHYACATRGECGTVPPESLAGYPDIAALRTEELLCAARALGLAAVHFLGHRDSGMPGAPDNRHPDALVGAPPERVTGQLVALIRALRPQVVLTFGPYGGYGHPDHIAVHRAATVAFAAAGDPARYPEQVAAGLPPWRPDKLYYPTFSTAMLRTSIGLLRLLRKDPRRFGEHGDVDLVRALARVTPGTTAIDCRGVLARKDRAWACHRSQLGSMARLQRLPRALRRRFYSTEYLTRVVPPPEDARGRPRERDLFANVRA